MVLREKVSDLITTPTPPPPNTPCFLSPEHEVVSTLKAKIIIFKGFFDNFLTKKQKFRTMSNISPQVHLLGYFPSVVPPVGRRTENVALLNKRLDELIECN